MIQEITESRRRLYEKLYRDLGESIIQPLQDTNVNEIMLNPDGSLWIDSVKDGQIRIGELSETGALAIINTIAGIHGLVIANHNPHIEAELPLYLTLRGERFTAQIQPIVSKPSFCIRKRSEVVFSLADYVESGRLTQSQSNILQLLTQQRKNILVCGGPGTGKTTVTNALIIEAVKPDENQRFLILEDVPELQCSAKNKVSMLTSRYVDMTELLRNAMRMRPDRILIGEVRGKEALTMLKAWNTGCPGGICTVHANGAEEAIQRILDLSMEAGLVVPPINLVVHTIDVIVSLVRQGTHKGFIKEILQLKEYTNEKFEFEKLG